MFLDILTRHTFSSYHIPYLLGFIVILCSVFHQAQLFAKREHEGVVQMLEVRI